MSQEFSVITQSVVALSVTSSMNTFGSERRFQKDMTIADLKGKLELLTGATAANMKLELYNKDNKLVSKVDNDGAMLGSYPVDDGMRLHVIDSSVKVGEFEDVSKVEKFEISKEEYEKRTDSVRAFKEKHKLGRFQEVDPEEQKRLDEEKAKKEQEEKEKAESMKIGDRCEARVPGQPTRRGCVQFIGLKTNNTDLDQIQHSATSALFPQTGNSIGRNSENGILKFKPATGNMLTEIPQGTTDFKPGYWIGVKYDEPVGKNDGSVKGRRYFTCPPKYGGFIRPEHLEVGDFPEELDELMDDDDEI